MKALLIPVLLALVLILAIGCSAPADASGPYLVKNLTLTTSRTFVALQDSLSSTTKKTAYVLALEDDLEVTAWRYNISAAAREWVLVFPGASFIIAAFSDSVMICPTGYVLPVEGEFDALTIKGTVSGGACQVQAYK